MPHSSKSAVKGSAIKKGIKSRITKAALGRVALPLALSVAALGQAPSNTPPGPGASTEELQKATQNPVASLITVPFQNNVDENIGLMHTTETRLTSNRSFRHESTRTGT
jgi:hypothetical protein